MWLSGTEPVHCPSTLVDCMLEGNKLVFFQIWLEIEIREEYRGYKIWVNQGRGKMREKGHFLPAPFRRPSGEPVESVQPFTFNLLVQL